MVLKSSYTPRHFGSKKWDKPQKSGFENFFFDFFKFIWNVPKWCRIGLGVSFGSQGISFTILDHLQTIFENFSKTQNPAWEADFCLSSCILLAKTRFPCMLSGLMSLRIMSYERTLVARRTLGHYLKLRGSKFADWVDFVKKLSCVALRSQKDLKLNSY